jgi:phage FluMu protein Com
MPIRFACPECKQLLGVSARKAGTQVKCPKCNAVITVPTADEAAAPINRGKAIASDAASGTEIGAETSRFEHPDIEETLSRLVVYDRAPAEAARAGQAAGTAQPDQDERAMLLIPRKVLYMQAGLLAAVAILFFLAGWWIGRGHHPAPVQNIALGGGSATVDVLLHYRGANGDLKADDGAVVLVLPLGRRVSDKIDAAPLDPASPAPNAASPVIAKLNHLGGSYARADADGKVALIVPELGKHHVLLLSNHARRAGEPRPQDLAALGTFLEGAAELLSNRDYRLTIEDFSGPLTIAYDFGVKPGG